MPEPILNAVSSLFAAILGLVLGSEVAASQVSPTGARQPLAERRHGDLWYRERGYSTLSPPQHIPDAPNPTWDWSVAEACHCPTEAASSDDDSSGNTWGWDDLPDTPRSKTYLKHILLVMKAQRVDVDFVSARINELQERLLRCVQAERSWSRALRERAGAVKAKWEQLQHDIRMTKHIISLHGIPLPPSAFTSPVLPPAAALLLAAQCDARSKVPPIPTPAEITRVYSSPSLLLPAATAHPDVDAVVFAMRAVRPWCDAGQTLLSARGELVALQGALLSLFDRKAVVTAMKLRCAVEGIQERYVSWLPAKKAESLQDAALLRESEAALLQDSQNLCEQQERLAEAELVHGGLLDTLRTVQHRLLWRVLDWHRTVQLGDSTITPGAHTWLGDGEVDAQLSAGDAAPVFVLDSLGRVRVSRVEGVFE